MAAGSGEWISVQPETYQVLAKSLWIAKESGGAFDITVGAFKGLWKFDEDNDGTLPVRADVQRRLPLVDYCGVLLEPDGHRARLGIWGVVERALLAETGFWGVVQRALLAESGFERSFSARCLRRPDFGVSFSVRYLRSPDLRGRSARAACGVRI